MPLTVQMAPLTASAQFPCEPTTRTLPSAGPGSGVPGSVGSGVGVVVPPLVAYASTSQREKP